MLQNLRLTRYPSARAEKGLAAPRRRTSMARRIAGALVILLLLTVIAVGAGVALVFTGPIEVGFLRGQIDGAIERALGGRYEASVESVKIGVDPVLGLVVRVGNVSVADAAGNVVALVPSSLIAIDALAIFTPKAVIRSVEVNNATISVLRAEDGRMLLGVLETPVPPRPEPQTEGEKAVGFDMIFGPLAALDRGLTGSLDRAAAAGFERFSALQTTVELWDAKSGEPRRFGRSDLNVSLTDGGNHVVANLSSAGYSGRWTATAERSINPENGERTLSTVFSQLTFADLFPKMGTTRAAFTSDIPLYGRSTVTLSSGGKVEAASVRLDLGAGTIAYRSEEDSILLDEATVKLHWDVDRDVIVIDPSSFYFGLGRAVFTGQIRQEGPPEERRFGFEVQARNAVVAPRDSAELPLVVDSIRFAGAIDFESELVRVDTAAISTDAGSVVAAGSIGLEGRSPSIAAAASFTRMPVATVKQLWPPFLVGGTRRWVLKNVFDGELVNGHLQAEIPAGTLFTGERPQLTEEQLRLEFQVADVSFKTFGAIPDVHNASGIAVLAGSTFGLDMQNGEVTTPSGQQLAVTAGALAIPDTSSLTPFAQMEVQVAAGARAMGEVANADPIRAFRGRDIDPSGLTGDGQARISAKWPLRAEITMDDVDWRVNLQLKEFASRSPLEGRSVAKGEVTIDADPEFVRIGGRAEVDGVPASVDLSFPMDGGQSGSQNIRLALDDQARERLGFDLEGIIGGTIAVDVKDLGEGRAGQHFELDLTPARITLAALGWSKGIGVPARLTFDLVKADEGYDVIDLSLTGDGFGLAGSAKLDAGYLPVSGAITDFVLRRNDDLRFTFKRTTKGYELEASGDAFDVRGLLSGVGAGLRGPGDAPDLQLNARIGRLIGFNGEEIRGARLGITVRDGRLARAELNGTLNGGPLGGTYADPGADGSIDVSVADGGALFRFLNFYNRLQGGALTIVGAQRGEGALSGTFDLANFTVVDEAAMDNLINTVGSDGQPTGMNPRRLMFDRMAMEFTWLQGRIVIDDAVLRGPMIGAIWSGFIDIADAGLELTGTYLPAYRINNIFGQIPILGLALGAGEREGLVGITFKVQGPIDQVRVAINPLSAIAPGIFRKIFEFQ